MLQIEDSSVATLINATLADFDTKLQNAINLDAQVQADGLLVSQDYADLLALSLRQVMASIDIVVPLGSDGHFNISATMAFMKNMGAITGRSVASIAYEFPVMLTALSARPSVRWTSYTQASQPSST